MKFIVLICLLSGCDMFVPQKPTPVIHEKIDVTGTSVKISIPSKKIVSISSGITESLYALGAGEHIIAVTDNCSLPQAKGKERIGSKGNILLKKIIQLSPELILSNDNDMTEETITNLRDMGITVFVLKTGISPQDIAENFRFLGTITGKQNIAEMNIAEANEKIEGVAERIKNIQRPRVFLEVGAKPLTTVGADSFANTIISLSGGENIVSGKTKFPFYSVPAVIKNNPDVIILSSVLTEEKLRWKQIESITASQNNRIYSIDPNLMNVSTPLALAKAVEKVSMLLYPTAGASPH
ncbi:MAG: helical backbone metal receptor [Candidatus Desantisbacteria bacterium]